MKKPAAFCFLAFVLAAGIGCEQQSYEETKMFNQSTDVHSHGGHGGDHGKAGDHGKGGEKKSH